MRILVTGAGGYLGSWIAPRLQELGHEVVGYSRTSCPNLGLADWRTGDVSDADALLAATRGCEVVVHLAVQPQYRSELDPRSDLETNTLGTLQVLRAAKAAGVRRFLLASTSEIYGDPEIHPQPETYAGNVDPTGTRAVYDEAKRFAESLTMAYHRAHGIDTRIVRIFNTYGPRMDLEDGRALPNLLKQALLGQPLTVYGKGEQTRSFCYVDDLVEGIVCLLYSNEHMPVNIGNPNEMSILQFAESINRITGNQAGITYVPDARSARDPQRRQPDITRAREILHWEAGISLDEGLRKTIPYFKQKLGLA